MAEETPAPNGADKRRHERYGVKCAIVVRDGDRRLGTVEDLSRGGMRVRLDGEIGENEEVREWTGRKNVDNREYVLNQMVGEEFDLSLIYLAISLGRVKAKLVRVIRSMNRLFFAMQFTAIDEALLNRLVGIVNRK